MFRNLVVILVLLIAAGCTGKGPEDVKKAGGGAGTPSVPPSVGNSPEETVKRYNQLLADGYKSLNMTQLQEVASTDQAEKAYIHMAAIGEGKVRMVSRLKKIDFQPEQTPKSGQCRLTSHEVWDFAYEDITSGAKSGEEKDYAYDVTYLLQMNNGRWQVIDVKATGEDRNSSVKEPRRIKALH